jgi:hypothetical protein
VNTITHRLANLYSLDLSFCSNVTARSLFNLLDVRGQSLAEFRIQCCPRLDIAAAFPGTGSAGTLILNALRLHVNAGGTTLSVLDVRYCGAYQEGVGYAEEDPFVVGMSQLGFTQNAHGFFSRSACWNADVDARLVNQLF